MQRAMLRASAKREKKIAKAKERLSEAYADPEYRAELGLPDDMPRSALEVMADAEARLRTRYNPTTKTMKKYGLVDAPGFRDR